MRQASVAPLVVALAVAIVAPGWLVSGTALAAGNGQTTATPDRERLQRRALLVGCTRYRSGIPSLEGPGNDVLLVKYLLSQTFKFDPIVVLSEQAAGQDLPAAAKKPTLRPTRENIRREFQALATQSRAGDQVFILLCGHGSQQPDRAPYDEPDGLDEVFLPADTGAWEPARGMIENAIVDDEFNDWVGRIAKTGASVAIVFDSCHAGTLLRGAVDEVTRNVPVGEIIAEDAINKARLEASGRFSPGSRGAAMSPAEFDALDGDVVAIYAARSDEKEMEMLQPARSGQCKMFGRLTYTLCRLLTPKPDKPAPPLTYRELVQRVQQEYVAEGIRSPTPSVEGAGMDRELFGLNVWPARSQFVLTAVSNNWSVNGGKLHGLTERSILAIYPPPGEKPNAIAGYVTVREVGAVASTVEPCGYRNTSKRLKLPEGGLCEPVYIDLGDLRLNVAVEAVGGADAPSNAAILARTTQSLKKIASGENSLIQLVDRPNEANWRVQIDQGRVYLVPVDGVAVRADDSSSASFGPLPVDQQHEELKSHLQRIARSEMLKSLATPAAANLMGSPSSVDVACEILKFKDENDPEPAVEKYRAGFQMREGDLVAFRITNRSATAKVYVTLLFIDSQCGIEAMYPIKSRLPEVVLPGKSMATAPWYVTATTVGTESVVVIAVKAAGPPTDFTCLAQPRLDQARGARGAADVLGSPLGKILENALYAQGPANRGFDRAEIGDYAVRLLSWETVPKSSDSGAKSPIDQR